MDDRSSESEFSEQFLYGFSDIGDIFGTCNSIAFTVYQEIGRNVANLIEGQIIGGGMFFLIYTYPRE